jgi:hypothetical protein
MRISDVPARRREALAGLALAALAASGVPVARAADAFVAGLEDLPLMPSLVERAEQRVKFDSAGGRVVEAVAQGAVARGAVLEFYARALPELGWRAEGEGVWAREGERLRIEFPPPPRGAPAGETTVRFYLAPG